MRNPNHCPKQNLSHLNHPKQNLIRTKAQFKLLQSLEAHAEEMDAFVQTL